MWHVVLWFNYVEVVPTSHVQLHASDASHSTNSNLYYLQKTNAYKMPYCLVQETYDEVIYFPKKNFQTLGVNRR